MVRLVGEANCSRAARALVLAGKIVVGDSERSVVPDAAWRFPSLLPVGVIPGEEAHRSPRLAAVSGRRCFSLTDPL
eukprot:1197365-Alexandrium_andersonii.AAC.1